MAEHHQLAGYPAKLEDFQLKRGEAVTPADASATIVYIHVPEQAAEAARFAETYHANRPGYDHKTVIVCQNCVPAKALLRRFASLPDSSLYHHDDSGFDIGGYLAVALEIKTEVMVCFGGTAYFQRAGWLERMMAAWQKHGPGFYGGKATYEVSPHLNTCGFWTSPRLLMRYPVRVTTKRARYDFEHGPKAMWRMVHHAGMPAKLVTWDGEYDWDDWRRPANGFRGGDQSDCLTRFHHNDKFDQASPAMRRIMTASTEKITDPFFSKLMSRFTPPKDRLTLLRMSACRLDVIHKF